MLLMCLISWCGLGAAGLSQFQHSTGKTGFPLKGEWLDILGANFLCKTLAKFAQLEISVV